LVAATPMTLWSKRLAYGSSSVGGITRARCPKDGAALWRRRSMAVWTWKSSRESKSKNGSNESTRLSSHLLILSSSKPTMEPRVSIAPVMIGMCVSSENWRMKSGTGRACGHKIPHFSLRISRPLSLISCANACTVLRTSRGGPMMLKSSAIATVTTPLACWEHRW
jgi:hypothetical protein